MKLSIFIFLKSGAMIFPGRFSVNICQEFWYKNNLIKADIFFKTCQT